MEPLRRPVALPSSILVNVFQHHNGVINHKANSQHNAQQRKHINGETHTYITKNVPIRDKWEWWPPNESVVRQSRKKMKIIITTSAKAMKMVSFTSEMESRMCVESKLGWHIEHQAEIAPICASLTLTRFGDIYVSARLRNNGHREFHFALTMCDHSLDITRHYQYQLKPNHVAAWLFDNKIVEIFHGSEAAMVRIVSSVAAPPIPTERFYIFAIHRLQYIGWGEF